MRLKPCWWFGVPYANFVGWQTVVWWAPAWFHVFFTGCLFIVGFYLENGWMTAASILNLAVGVAIHVLPVRYKKS